MSIALQIVLSFQNNKPEAVQTKLVKWNRRPEKTADRPSGSGGRWWRDCGEVPAEWWRAAGEATFPTSGHRWLLAVGGGGMSADRLTADGIRCFDWWLFHNCARRRNVCTLRCCISLRTVKSKKSVYYLSLRAKKKTKYNQSSVFLTQLFASFISS